MLLRKIVFLIFILALSFSVYSQDILNPLEPKEKGKDILEYINTVDKIYPVQKSLQKLSKMNYNSQDFKKLIALAIFSRINNPYEYYTVHKNFDEVRADRFSFAKSEIVNVFITKDRYKEFKFNNKKYWLRDLYWAPFVFVGTITKIDTMCYALTGKSAPVIKLEMSDIENVNKYYKTYVRGKKVQFVFSTAHRALQYPSWLINPEEDFSYDHSDVVSYRIFHDFIIGRRFLVFLYPEFGHSKCLSSLGIGHLPYLHITALGIEGFPVEQSEIVDVNQYFGKGERISLSEAKTIINSVMDEISKWRRE